MSEPRTLLRGTSESTPAQPPFRRPKSLAGESAGRPAQSLRAGRGAAESAEFRVSAGDDAGGAVCEASPRTARPGVGIVGSRIGGLIGTGSLAGLKGIAMAKTSGERARNNRMSSGFTLGAVLCSASVRWFDLGGFDMVLLGLAIALWLVAAVYFLRALRSPRE